MKNLLAGLLGWLSGKKTYLLAIILILTVSVFVFLGRLTPEAAMTIALIFLGLFAASFRSALAKHEEQVMAVLTDTAALGKAVASKNGKLVAAAGIALVTDGSTLASQIQAEQGQTEAPAK